jgi:uncharacterized protein
MMRHRISPQRGTAFELARGDVLRVIDPQGEQVADLIAFVPNRSNPLLTIVRDTVGRHDFLYTPCSPETFAILYNHKGHHPSCFENLITSLRPWRIDPDSIPTTFNIFMNVEVSRAGVLSVRPPLSRPGDSIELRAEADLVVGLTACSAELSNNYRFKPIDFEIVRHAPGDFSEVAGKTDEPLHIEGIPGRGRT